MNKNTIEGLKKIHEGLGIIISSFESSPIAITESTPVSPIIEKSSDNEPKDIESMSYTELKAHAKKLGIPARGDRQEIIDRIRESEGSSVEEEPKSNVTVISPVSEETPVEDSVDPLYEQVIESISELSNEELADILSEAKLSPKGKREALIHRIYEGVKSGAIEFDSESSEDVDAPIPSSEESEETYFNDPENMTKLRKEAVDKYVKDTRESIEAGDFSAEELTEWLSSYDQNGELGLNTLEGEDLVEAYLYYSSLLIDDEGNEVEEGAYMINEVAFCCGHPLQYDEDNKQYICEVCGSVYGAE